MTAPDDPEPLDLKTGRFVIKGIQRLLLRSTEILGWNVNLRWIEGVEIELDGRLMAKLTRGRQVEISRRQSRRLKELLSL